MPGSGRPRVFGEWHSADHHAVALIECVRAAGITGSVLAGDLMELHQRLCDEQGWLPRRWNPIARAIALRTTGGRKIYADVDGRRMRIYPLHSFTDEAAMREPRAEGRDSHRSRLSAVVAA